MDWIQTLRKCLARDAILYTGHARREMKLEPFGEIKEEEVSEAVSTCEVLTAYPEDKPYPSALMLGRTKNKRPLHLVYAYDSENQQAIIITVYQPDPRLWEDSKKRKK